MMPSTASGAAGPPDGFGLLLERRGPIERLEVAVEQPLVMAMDAGAVLAAMSCASSSAAGTTSSCGGREHQPHLGGFGPGEHAPGQQQIERPLHADEAREDPRRVGVGDDAPPRRT